MLIFKENPMAKTAVILGGSVKHPRMRRALARAVRKPLFEALVILMVGIGIWRYAPLIQTIYHFGMAVSSQPPLSTQTLLFTNPTRINLVFFGYGGPGHEGAYLTDTILLLSYDPQSGHTALISVPRDLWVSLPVPGSFGKINAVYAYGMRTGGRRAAGMLATQSVSNVVGLNVTHWVSIDFTGFRALIDAIGGIDFSAPNAFLASLSPLHTSSTRFFSGFQHMDGARALLYVRARYCEPASQASDFAREERQQIVAQAIAAKLHRLDLTSALPGLLNAIQPYLATNVSVLDLTLFFLHADFAHARQITLNTRHLLSDAVSNDGQDILQPTGGSWEDIQAYVRDQLNTR